MIQLKIQHRFYFNFTKLSAHTIFMGEKVKINTTETVFEIKVFTKRSMKRQPSELIEVSDVDDYYVYD